MRTTSRMKRSSWVLFVALALTSAQAQGAGWSQPEPLEGAARKQALRDHSNVKRAIARAGQRKWLSPDMRATMQQANHQLNTVVRVLGGARGKEVTRGEFMGDSVSIQLEGSVRVQTVSDPHGGTTSRRANVGTLGASLALHTSHRKLPQGGTVRSVGVSMEHPSRAPETAQEERAAQRQGTPGRYKPPKVHVAQTLLPRTRHRPRAQLVTEIETSTQERALPAKRGGAGLPKVVVCDPNPQHALASHLAYARAVLDGPNGESARRRGGSLLGAVNRTLAGGKPTITYGVNEAFGDTWVKATFADGTVLKTSHMIERGDEHLSIKLAPPSGKARELSIKRGQLGSAIFVKNTGAGRRVETQFYQGDVTRHGVHTSLERTTVRPARR